MKVLILYTNTGAGHISAGKAIADAFKNLDIDTIEIDTLKFAGKSTSKSISNTYINIVKNNPKFFGLLYKAGATISNPKIKSIIYVLNTLYANKIYNIIKKEVPDLIICTHIFCAQTISHLKKKYSFTALTAAVITDYTCAPFWEETNLNYYFIPHKDLIKEFVDKGMNIDTLIPLGLPVHSKFNIHCNKTESKKILNLKEDLPHILIMGGSMGAGNIFETSLELFKAFKNVQFTVVCGSNTTLYERFKKESLQENINILQFTNSIPELMDSSDILITKPGGLTSTEAMIKSLPIIMINPIPGVETANCNFFTSHNVAFSSKSIGETIIICKSLLNNSINTNDMKAFQKININSNAAKDIANFLIQKITTSKI